MNLTKANSMGVMDNLDLVRLDDAIEELKEMDARRKKCGCVVDEFCDDCSGFDDAKQSGTL